MRKRSRENPEKVRRAPHTDEFGCFNIRDFKKNDSVYYLDGERNRNRGVVVSVDLEYNLITLRTSSGEIEARVSDITYLDSYRRDWID